MKRVLRAILAIAFILTTWTLGGVAPAFAGQGVSLTVNTISRTPSGSLSYDANVAYSGLNAPGGVCSVYWSNCAVALQVQYVGDAKANTLAIKAIGGGDSTSQFTAIVSSPQIVAIRAIATVGRADTPDVVTDWQQVSDPWQPQTVSLSVNSVTRNSSGLLSYDVTAHVERLTETGAVCAWGTFYCNVQLFLRSAADGTSQLVQTLKVNDSVPLDMHFTATGNRSQR